MTTPRLHLTEARKRQLAYKQGYQCAQCQDLLSSTWCSDHIQPLHQGGSNHFDNFQILCPNCHALKTQHEMVVLAEKQKEKRTGRSRYFDPISVDFLGNQSFAEFSEKFRFQKQSRLSETKSCPTL
jgi:hypothetical protein